MRESYADVTVHINETLDQLQLQSLVEMLRQQRGVSKVHAHEERPHLMIVKFDPGEITSLAIHRAVTEQGFNAELIGL